MKSSSFNEYSDNRDMWVLSGKRIKNRIKEIKIIHNGKEKALTQKGLVEKCNEVGNIPFHEQYISEWIHGEKRIDPQYWHALCTVLDCDPEWLICELPEDCRHIQHADAHERYGLSEEALMKLQVYAHSEFRIPFYEQVGLEYLDDLICDQHTFMLFLQLCNTYKYSIIPDRRFLDLYINGSDRQHIPAEYSLDNTELSIVREQSFIKALRNLFESDKKTITIVRKD